MKKLIKIRYVFRMYYYLIRMYISGYLFKSQSGIDYWYELGKAELKLRDSLLKTK